MASNGVSFEPNNDVLLLTLMAKHRRRWKDIQKQYNDTCRYSKRSVNSLRNRWQRILRGFDGESANCSRCRRCGEPKIGHVCTVGLTDITQGDIQRLIECAKCTKTDELDGADDSSDSQSTTETVIDPLASAPLAKREADDDDEDEVLLVKEVLVEDEVLLVKDGMLLDLLDGMVDSPERRQSCESDEVECFPNFDVQVANELLALPDANELEGMTAPSDDVSNEDIVKGIEMQDEMLYDVDEDDLVLCTNLPMH